MISWKADGLEGTDGYRNHPALAYIPGGHFLLCANAYFIIYLIDFTCVCVLSDACQNTTSMPGAHRSQGRAGIP